jgi:hypothetical protein
VAVQSGLLVVKTPQPDLSVPIGSGDQLNYFTMARRSEFPPS